MLPAAPLPLSVGWLGQLGRYALPIINRMMIFSTLLRIWLLLSPPPPPPPPPRRLHNHLIGALSPPTDREQQALDSRGEIYDAAESSDINRNGFSSQNPTLPRRRLLPQPQPQLHEQQGERRRRRRQRHETAPRRPHGHRPRGRWRRRRRRRGQQALREQSLDAGGPQGQQRRRRHLAGDSDDEAEAGILEGTMQGETRASQGRYLFFVTVKMEDANVVIVHVRKYEN